MADWKVVRSTTPWSAIAWPSVLKAVCSSCCRAVLSGVGVYLLVVPNTVGKTFSARACPGMPCAHFPQVHANGSADRNFLAHLMWECVMSAIDFRLLCVTRVLPSVISMTALLLRAAGVHEERTAWRSRVRTLPQCSSEDCCSCSFHSRFGWKLSWRFSRVRTRDWARAGSTACCDSRQSASRCPMSLNLGGACACGTKSFAVESFSTS